MWRRQGRQRAVAEAVTGVMIKRQVAVAPFDAGATALEEVRAAEGDRFDLLGSRGHQGLEWMRWLA
jgi:hypothetical protein